MTKLMDIQRNHTLSQLQDTKGDILAAGRDKYKDKNKDNDKGHGYSKKPDAFTSAGFKR